MYHHATFAGDKIKASIQSKRIVYPKNGKAIIITNDAVLAKMKESKLHFADSIMKQKLSYAGHVLRGSSGKKCSADFGRQV